MKFTMIGELYLSVDKARWWRRRIAENRAEWEAKGAYLELGRHAEYEREIVRHYPIELTVRAYEIDRATFEELKDILGLWPTDTPTMGTIGGDGGIGWTPAMNWDHESDAYNGSFGNVYVTPWPETVRPITRGHSWERVVAALMRTYG